VNLNIFNIYFLSLQVLFDRQLCFIHIPVACTVFQDLIASPPDFSFCSWPNKFAMVIIYFML